jgi:nicotinamidase/pyrazinamidase
MAKQRIHLVIIDPQNDFCDLPAEDCPIIGGVQQVPALPVAGAHADLMRVAELIRAGASGLSAISLTLDAHQRVDIAHPTFWRQGDGSAVGAFTQIRAADVRAGRFLPRRAEALPRVLAYLDALEVAGRYVHMVWPVHCEIGTWGHSVHAAVRAAYNDWEEANAAVVHKVFKGSNPWTEHFSAIQAEVPDADDADTQLNADFLGRLATADRVLFAGEAGSHCVRATVEHVVENWPAGELGRLVLLTDCMSAVGGFEAQYAEFLENMRQRGLELSTSADILPVLQQN